MELINVLTYELKRKFKVSFSHDYSIPNYMNLMRVVHFDNGTIIYFYSDYISIERLFYDEEVMLTYIEVDDIVNSVVDFCNMSHGIN